jgi:hypothetical protein
VHQPSLEFRQYRVDGRARVWRLCFCAPTQTQKCPQAHAPTALPRDPVTVKALDKPSKLDPDFRREMWFLLSKARQERLEAALLAAAQSPQQRLPAGPGEPGSGQVSAPM